MASVQRRVATDADAGLCGSMDNLGAFVGPLLAIGLVAAFGTRTVVGLPVSRRGCRHRLRHPPQCDDPRPGPRPHPAPDPTGARCQSQAFRRGCVPGLEAAGDVDDIGHQVAVVPVGGLSKPAEVVEDCGSDAPASGGGDQVVDADRLAGEQVTEELADVELGIAGSRKGLRSWGIVEELVAESVERGRAVRSVVVVEVDAFGEAGAENVKAVPFLAEDLGPFAFGEAPEVGSVHVVGGLGAAEAGGLGDGTEGLPLTPEREDLVGIFRTQRHVLVNCECCKVVI